FSEANRLWRAGKYQEALPVAQKVVDLEKKESGENSLIYGSSLFLLANQYDGLDDESNAEKYFLMALDIRQAILGGNSQALTPILNNLTMLYGDRGDYVSAEKYANRSYEIKKSADPDPNSPSLELARSLTNLAIVNHLKGDDINAAKYYKMALDIRLRKQGNKSGDVAAAMNNLAGVYTDLDAAEKLYIQALDIAKEALGETHQFTGQIMFNTAVLYERKGDYDKAEDYCQKALTVYRKSFVPGSPNLALPLDLLGTIYMDKGDLDKSENYYLQAIALREKQGQYHPYLGTSLANLASLYRLKGEIDKAIATQTRANAILEYNTSLNLASGSERQKLGYLDLIKKEEGQTLRLSLQAAPTSADAANLAANLILQRKGRVLDALSDSIEALRRRSNDQDRALFDKFDATSRKLASLVLSGPGSSSGDDYQKKIDLLQDDREKLEEEMSSRSAGFLSRPMPVTVEAVKAAVPADAALIEFSQYRPYGLTASDKVTGRFANDPKAKIHYAAFVIRPGVPAKGIDIGVAEDIDKVLDDYRGALRDPKRTDFKQLARTADEKVMQPLRSLLGGASHLLISPEGDLNLIPFEAFVDSKGKYLVESYSVSYLTSGRDLLRMNQQADSETASLVVADPQFGVPDGKTAGVTRNSKGARRARRSVTTVRNLADAYFAPLSGTAVEARSIRAMFPEAKVLTGELATETSLKQAKAPKILHIATHGFFIEDQSPSGNAPNENPLLRSGLALAGANKRSSGQDDGILTALEASGLDLWGTRLVVLSACDTGIGEVRTGEGVYGLRRAFFEAGAESLVMSLWPVSDIVTRDLMIGYYKNLKQGAGRGEALRQVQLQMLKRPERKHPFYWASFIQAGEWANLEGHR
ncbi:MAG: CHAT domain-containing tetratricopeptide repeat protein, partial [Pyrinomonadaceae bacterium]